MSLRPSGGLIFFYRTTDRQTTQNSEQAPKNQNLSTRTQRASSRAAGLNLGGHQDSQEFPADRHNIPPARTQGVGWAFVASALRGLESLKQGVKSKWQVAKEFFTRQTSPETPSEAPKLKTRLAELGEVSYQQRDLRRWARHFHESGNRSIDDVAWRFKVLIQSQKGLKQPEREKLFDTIDRWVELSKERIESAKEKNLAREEFALTDRVLETDKAFAAHLKDLGKAMGKEMQSIVSDFATNVAFSLSDRSSVNNDISQEIQNLRKKISTSVSSIEGRNRLEVVQNHPMWDPNSSDFPFLMQFPSSGRGKINLASTFKPEGPGRTSQAPRNNADDPVMANFHRTELKAVGESSRDPQSEIFSATRSAIPVEFDVEDRETRAEKNSALVKQQVDAQARHMLSGLSKEELLEAIKNGEPIVLHTQTINLLTPDIGRTWAHESDFFADLATRATGRHAGAAADDERMLALENLKAHQDWDGKTQSYPVNIGGEVIDVPVKYDINYFNVPNNKLAEKYREKGLDEALRPPEIEAANNKSWDKLDKTVDAKIKKMDAKIEELFNSDKLGTGEKQELRKLLELSRKKQERRNRIAEKTIKSGSLSETKEEFEQWQKEANTLAERFANTNVSDEMKDVLAFLENRENLLDLRVDTKELIKSGMAKDPKYMDNNRSGLATRLAVLSYLAGREVHFGCRSGKDRTGLVDIDIKVLLGSAKALHRMLSYREQEKHPFMLQMRKEAMEKSGNRELAEANMGELPGVNVGGSHNLAPNADAEKLHNKMVAEINAMAAAAHRPITKEKVKPSFLQKWREIYGTAIQVKPSSS